MNRTRTFALAALAALAVVGCKRETPPEGMGPEAQDQALMYEDQVVPLALILSDPMTWSGREVEGNAYVASVVSDRGFFLQDGDNRIFALIVDQPAERPMQIQQGQQLRIESATIRTVMDLGDLEGEPITEETERIAHEQGVFLVIDEDDMEIVSGPGSS